jgi:hypothetical protein
MKTTITIATAICSVIGLNFTPPAEAARSIRTDTNPSNGWTECSGAATCPSLPSGLAVNPFGVNPAAAPTASSSFGGTNTAVPDAQGGPDAQTPCISGSCSAPGWSVNVPGLSNLYTNGPIQSQVLYFNLSNQSGQSVYSPNPSFDAATGNPIALGLANGTAWEIEFNYNAPPVTPASLDLDGKVFTASAAVLDNSALDEFVYYGGKLYAPQGWIQSPGTVAAPELNPTIAVSAFTFLLCGLAILRGRRSRTLAS